MWIEQLDNGKYKYFERYTDPLTEKQKRVSVILAKKTPQAKKEAQRLLDEKIDQKLESTSTESVTLKRAYTEWFAIYKNTVKPTSSFKVKYSMDHIYHIISPDALLNKISTTHVQRLINYLYYEKDYSFSYTESIKIVLGMIIDYGIEQNYAEKNPVKMVKIKKKPKTLKDIERIENKYLEKEEVQLILDEMRKSPKSKRNADVVEFIFYTGLRIGELMALQYEDYDGENIYVKGTLDYTTRKISEGVKGTTKNESSTRMVNLPERAKEIIDRVIEENKLIASESPNYVEKNFIFTSYTGNPVAILTVNASLQNVAKKIGLNKHLTSHILRHSHISLLAELGIPVKAIMDRVGHSDADTTLKIYTHVTENMKTNIVEKLNSIRV